MIDELDQSLGKDLGAIQSGLRDYNQSIENNFKEIVKISNPMISEAASYLQTQIEELVRATGGIGFGDLDIHGAGQWKNQVAPDHLNSSLTDLMTSLMVIFILLLLVFVHRTAGKDAAVTDVSAQETAARHEAPGI